MILVIEAREGLTKYMVGQIRFEYDEIRHTIRILVLKKIHRIKNTKNCVRPRRPLDTIATSPQHFVVAQNRISRHRISRIFYHGKFNSSTE